MTTDGATIDWLLDSDPALRWQVERDLLDVPEAVWRATRARVATEGLGARLLALQDPDGQWAGGSYFPAGFDMAAEGAQPWTATTWSLNALREWGVDAAALGDTARRLDDGCRWDYGGLPYWGGEVDCCINGFTLANGGWLGADVAGLLTWFAEHRMGDGGWNCEWEHGATRSSFHSTINALVGILAYEEHVGVDTAELRGPAEEYLLERQLVRRLGSGEVVGDWVANFAHPPRWVYSALRAADHLRAAGRRDPRIAEAIDLIEAQRRPDGRWLQGRTLPGRVWFDVDVPTGAPSKWLTLAATRVLTWWRRDG